MDYVILAVSGVAAGLLGGMLGIGGGIVILPVLRFMIGMSAPVAAGTCIVAVFFTTAAGSYRHYKFGHVPLRYLLPTIVAGAASAVLFSLLFTKLAKKPLWLDFGMGLVFLQVSTRMFYDALSSKAKREEGSDVKEGKTLLKILIGAAGGVLPGLLGIGTGAVLVPAFRFLLGMPIKLAMGSSLACFCANAFISSAFKLAQGYVNLGMGLCAGAGTATGAYLGAIVNKNVPSRGLKLCFALLFLYVAAKFVFNSVNGLF